MILQFMHRMHKPASYPAEANERAPNVLATWLHYAPAAQPEERDWEDWFENAVMLHEAHLVCGAVQILGSDTGRVHTLGDNSPYVKPCPGGMPTFMYGMFRSGDTIAFPEGIDLVGNNADSVRLVQGYAKSPVFLATAGREFHVTGGDTDEIVDVLNKLHAAGHRKAFLKTSHKGMAMFIDLPEDPAQIRKVAIIDSELCWTLMSYEGAKDAFYIQEVFQPTKEYRTIIIGAQPVTGAGCVEAFTPLNNQGAAFDPQMEPVRNRSGVISDPETARRYEDFARAYAKSWAAENGDHHCYSLDLAIDARTGAVVAIEMNPLMNLGLYATDSTRLMAGVLARFGR